MKIKDLLIFHADIEIYFTVDAKAYVVEVKPPDYRLLIDKIDLEVCEINICRGRTYIFLKPLQKNTDILLDRAKEMSLKISRLKGEEINELKDF